MTLIEVDVSVDAAESIVMVEEGEEKEKEEGGRRNLGYLSKF